VTVATKGHNNTAMFLFVVHGCTLLTVTEIIFETGPQTKQKLQGT